MRILKKELHDDGGKWDLVVFHHSFEHLRDPEEALENVSRLLKTNGHCAIRVPTVSSYAWEHYGVKWVQLDAPRHFYLHSAESIRILVNESGLALNKIVYDSTSFQFWGSEQYKKDIPSMDQRSYWVNRKGSIFVKNEIADYERRAKLLNEEGRGDQAIFYLKNLQ